MTKKLIKISLNDAVEVELTNDGYKAYAEYVKELNKILPVNFRQNAKPALNKKGRYQTGLWQLITAFKNNIGLSLPTPFKDCSIYVEIEEDNNDR